MSEELARLAPEIVIVGTVCLAVVVVVVSSHWSKVRKHEDELDLMRQLVERGVPLEEIKQLLAIRTPPTKGLLEQFGALGGGTKAGLIFLAFMFCGIIMGVAQSYIFWVARK